MSFSGENVTLLNIGKETITVNLGDYSKNALVEICKKIKNHPFCKHIAKAPRAIAPINALSKSLQIQRTEKNCFNKFADTKKNKKR